VLPSLPKLCSTCGTCGTDGAGSQATPLRLHMFVCVCTCACCARAFGTQTVPPKAILRELSNLFGHADPLVRAEVYTSVEQTQTPSLSLSFCVCGGGFSPDILYVGQATKLAVALHRWIGAAISNFLQGLKPVQVRRVGQARTVEARGSHPDLSLRWRTQMKELEDAFQTQPPERPRPTRFTRAQQRAMNAGQAVPGALPPSMPLWPLSVCHSLTGRVGAVYRGGWRRGGGGGWGWRGRC
jgi:hypothetical protein